MTPPPVSNVKSLSMSKWAWAWGRSKKADLQGLDDGNAFNGARNPIRCLVWHSALCTLHSNSAPPSEIRAGMGTTQTCSPLRTTRNSSTAVRTCTACGGFDAAKDSDRSTAIQAKLYTVPVPYVQSSDGPGRLALSRVCDNCCEIYVRPPVVWKDALSTMTRRLLAPNSKLQTPNSPSSHQPVPSPPPAVSSQVLKSQPNFAGDELLLLLLLLLPLPRSRCQGYAPSCSPFSYGCC